MSKMNFTLLKALNALLEEKSVSRAAERLDMTQSGMSLALKELRNFYQDALFVRGQQGRMIPTAFAMTLIQPTQEALTAIDRVLTGHLPFEPATSEKVFHLGMSDHLALVLLPKLMQRLAHEAPYVRIIHHAINYFHDIQPLEENQLDMICGYFPDAPVSLKMTSLFRDKAVIVADKNHPLMRKRSILIGDLIKYPQVFISFSYQPTDNSIVSLLKKQGYEVWTQLMTPHTLVALQTLPGTLLIANVVEQLAIPFLEPLQLVMRNAPYSLRAYHASLYWHAKEQNNPAHQWMRNLIKSL